MVREPLRPDIKRYETREVTDHSHREQNRFDAKVAEARATLMTPYTNIKEVHIPVGPKGDIAITMRFDEEEGLVHNHKLIPHVCGKHGVKGEVQTWSVPAKGSSAKFIMVSGCGHDLISKNRAKKLGLEVEKSVHPMSFFTAKGVTSTNDVAKIHFDEFESTHTPYVLDESPSVLSVGKKCMEEGYSFVWPANGVPYMISPDNKKILLEVEGNIPYIVKDSDFCSPMIDEQTENISRMITGHIDVSYQPEIIDHEVDPQGLIATSMIIPTSQRRGSAEEGRKGIRPLQEKMKRKNMGILKSSRKQPMRMTQMISRSVSSTARVE